MIKFLNCLTFVGILTGCSMLPVSSPAIPIDTSLSSILAEDPTAVVEGCGHQPISGYTFCRKMEGQKASDVLIFITPSVICKKKPCIFVKIFSPQADMVSSFHVAEGQTKSEIPWSLLINKDKFTLQDRGFWPFVYQMNFTDSDGFERSLSMEGEIRLRVYKDGYLPLKNGQSDPMFAWEFIEGGVKIKITTGGRTYVAPIKKKAINGTNPNN